VIHSFALVRLQLDHICSLRPGSLGALSDALEQLPTQLDDFYHKAIQAIGAQREVLSLLSWILVPPKMVSEQVFASWEQIHPMQRHGALSTQELRHALAIRFRQRSHATTTQSLADIERYLPSLVELVNATAGLCEIDLVMATVTFTHPTVQEFLLSQQATLFPELQISRCRSCITYLSLEEFAKNGACTTIDDLQSRLEEYPLLEYASRHWCEIEGITQDADKINEANQPYLIELLSDKNLVASLQQLVNYSRGYGLTCDPSTGLLLAMQFNLLSVMEDLCSKQKSQDPEGLGAFIDQASSGGQRALDLAITATPPFVELLLRYEAHVEGPDGQNALALAEQHLPFRTLPGGRDIISMLRENQELERLGQVPIEKYPFTNRSAGDDQNSCAICLEPYDDQHPDWMRTLLPCGHHFHGSCLRSWFRIQFACSICRADLTWVWIDRDQPGEHIEFRRRSPEDSKYDREALRRRTFGRDFGEADLATMMPPV
jgi:hypothetical protein